MGEHLLISQGIEYISCLRSRLTRYYISSSNSSNTYVVSSTWGSEHVPRRCACLLWYRSFQLKRLRNDCLASNGRAGELFVGESGLLKLTTELLHLDSPVLGRNRDLGKPLAPQRASIKAQFPMEQEAYAHPACFRRAPRDSPSPFGCGRDARRRQSDGH